MYERNLHNNNAIKTHDKLARQRTLLGDDKYAKDDELISDGITGLYTAYCCIHV